MKNDKLLKILIAVATFIILASLAVLAILNFGDSSGNNKSDRETTVRQITSLSNKDSATTEEKSTTVASSEKVSSNSAPKMSATQATRTTTTKATPSSTTTEEKPNLEKAIEENANEERGERATDSNVAISEYNKVFTNQAEAHAYASAETPKLAAKLNRRISYEIRAVRGSDNKVTGWEAVFSDN